MRILVCGSRTWAAGDVLEAVLDWFNATHSVDGVVEGEAPGADLQSRQWAEEHNIPVLPFPAEWSTHGKAAGPIRNQQMLDVGEPDFVLAFVDKPLAESRGTADMVRRSRKAGLPVAVIEAFS